MLRVAYLSTLPPRLCGIGEYTWRLIKGLGGFGVDVLVLSSIDGVSSPSPAVRVYPVFRPGSGLYDDVIRVLGEVGGADILHVQHEYGVFPLTQGFMDFLERARGLVNAVVVTLHTVLHTSRGLRQVEYQRGIAKRVDAIIVHSMLQEHELLLQGVDAGRVHLIPHGSDVYDEDFCKGMSGGGDGVVYGVIGFIRWSKGLDVLAKAFRLAGRDISGARLLIAGAIQNPSGGESIRRVYEYLPGEMRDRVVVVDRYLDEELLGDVLRRVHVLVFPYREIPGYIPVSGALHMVIGCGKPLICSRAPRLVECSIYVPEITFPMGDHESLALLMKRYVENPGMFLEAGEKMRDYALRWSWERVAARHVELYEDLLSKNLS